MHINTKLTGALIYAQTSFSSFSFWLPWWLCWHKHTSHPDSCTHTHRHVKHHRRACEETQTLCLTRQHITATLHMTETPNSGRLESTRTERCYFGACSRYADRHTHTENTQSVCGIKFTAAPHAVQCCLPESLPDRWCLHLLVFRSSSVGRSIYAWGGHRATPLHYLHYFGQWHIFN